MASVSTSLKVPRMSEVISERSWEDLKEWNEDWLVNEEYKYSLLKVVDMTLDVVNRPMFGGCIERRWDLVGRKPTRRTAWTFRRSLFLSLKII